MKSLKILLLVLLCSYAGAVFSQTSSNKALTIGAQMPDQVFNQVMGIQQKTFNTADYKDKLVIYDFWATWCHWCIEAFPKNDSLQAKFGSKLKIMLVNCKDTQDTKVKVADFYEKRLKTHKNFKLPTIYEDTILTDLFPHQVIPHYAWVNKGVVIAITESSDVTAVNIQKVLDGEKIDLPVKQE